MRTCRRVVRRTSIVAALRIIGLCILAAVLYGVAHDQVTARVCVEYFTIGHPKILATESPTMLGLAWGIIATWWVGLLLGIPLAFVSTRGPRPRRTVSSLCRPIIILLTCMAGASLVSGFLGHVLAMTLARLAPAGADPAAAGPAPASGGHDIPRPPGAEGGVVRG